MTSPRTPVRPLLSGLALAGALALTGCGGDAAEPDAGPTGAASSSQAPSASGSPSESASPTPDRPTEEATPSQVVDIRIEGDEVSPQARAVEVGVDEPLRLTVTSDRPGELHVHSNPEQLPTFKAGNSSMELVFDKPGQVDVEEHESGVLILRVLVR